MKKTFAYILLCGLSLLFACTKNNGPQTPVSTMKGVFYASVSEGKEIQLLPGKSKNVDAFVCVKDSASSDISVKITLKVDPDGVAAYNKAGAHAELLPSSAYEFVKNDILLPRYNQKSTAAKIRITAQGMEEEKLYVLPLTVDKVEGTDNWELAENPFGFILVSQLPVRPEGPEGGDGSMEFPYELKTVQDLVDIRSKLIQDEKVYFKMMNDIDMSVMPPAKDNDGNVITDPDTGEPIPATWIPLNYASPYKLAIDFDGQGHTISNFFCDYADYPSFFGVLNGYCHDVTFTNAKVVATAARAGILGGYCGLQNGSLRGDCARVHIQGEMDHTQSGKYGAGGFFGFLGTGAMYACSADVIVNSKLNNVGGLFGYCGKEVEVIDCWTSGVITGNQRVGGIGGGTVGDDDPNIPIRIVNCYSTATVHGSFGIGGIGGYFCMAKATPNDVDPGNIFENCIAWNDEIKANANIGGSGEPTPGDMSHYSCGAVVGWTAVRNTLNGCLRNPAMKYNEAIFFDYTDAFSLYDQEDTSPTSPLRVNEVSGANYNYPYHGKAAPAGKTLSQIAKDLGWSTSVWNFSGDVPTLRPDAQVGPVPDVSTDGQLPGFDENDIK